MNWGRGRGREGKGKGRGQAPKYFGLERLLALSRQCHVDSGRRRLHAVASELWGQGVHCTHFKFRTCTPCTPQVKGAAYVKILSKRL